MAEPQSDTATPDVPRPEQIPDGLLDASSVFRTRALLLVLALVLFGLIYWGAIGWFAWLIHHRLTTGSGSILLPVFLLLVLLKGLFFSSGRPNGKGAVELRRHAHPRFFALLDEVALRVGASSPRTVWIEGRVNAAAVIPLSLRSFLFGGKKDLVLGLPLFEALTRSELIAVIGHEFGHFSQKTTSLDRWVYMASMTAQRMVHHRDWVDDSLEGLSKAYLATYYFIQALPLVLLISAVGGFLRGVVWAVRVLVELIHRLVIIAERQLSQEMEFQADLVAVSIAGSDALPNSLYKLVIADGIWDEVLRVMERAVRSGRFPPNLTTLQRRVRDARRYVFDDPLYGEAPAVPKNSPGAHRIFEANLVEAPRLWATHPPNNSREHNAKKNYVACRTDDRSPWTLFDDPEALQREVTVATVKQMPVRGTVVAMSEEEALEFLGRRYRSEALHPRYKGRFHQGSLARLHQSPMSLTGDRFEDVQELESALADAYPEDYRVLLRNLRTKMKFRAELWALVGGADRNRMQELHGERLTRKKAETLLLRVNSDIREIQAALVDLDHHGREAYLASACALGQGWDDYYRYLLSLLHVAAHQALSLEHAIDNYFEVLGTINFSRDVGRRERSRLTLACRGSMAIMDSILSSSRRVELPDLLRRELGGHWHELLPSRLPLVTPEPDSIFDSVSGVERWMFTLDGCCTALEAVTQNTILYVENYLHQCVTNCEDPGPAPHPGTLPEQELIADVDLSSQGLTDPSWTERLERLFVPVLSLVRVVAAGGILLGLLAILFGW